MLMLKQLDDRFEFEDNVETIMIPPAFVSFTQRYEKALSPHSDII